MISRKFQYCKKANKEFFHFLFESSLLFTFFQSISSLNIHCLHTTLFDPKMKQGCLCTRVAILEKKYINSEKIVSF